MMTPVFVSHDSTVIAHRAAGAQHTVCYAKLGIQQEPASELAFLAGRVSPESVTVIVDFDKPMMRRGLRSTGEKDR
jgi:hypothetical protein